MPESFGNPCACVPIPGTTPPGIAPYVVSINNLNGIITLGNTGAVVWTSVGNTLYADISGAAGLGSVTSVAISSPNSNLVVTSGSPITTLGTIVLNLAGNIGSISGLTMGADQMLYSTGANTFLATDLTAFMRTLLDDANAATARSTLGLVIGTNVQAWSADLDTFVTEASWSGSDLTLDGGLTTVGDIVCNNFTAVDGLFSGNLNVIGAIVFAGVITGDGSGLTNIDAEGIDTGTLDVARGGTNIGSYTIGDLIQATGATTLTPLAGVSAGSYLRSGGVGTANVWSTVKLPNTATTGDIWIASASNTIIALADVATGSVLRSGGVGVAPNYGKVTSSHVDSTIPTISGGANSDITSFTGPITFADAATFNTQIANNGPYFDVNVFEGNSGDILTSTGTATQWSNQIALDTLTINTSLSTEATITAGGTTGAQTINKLSGTVNFAAGASSLIVTNSLCTADTMIFCSVLTNDTTALIKNVVATSGSFTIRLNANATAETKVAFLLVQPS
jgi:hypothetical protein